ncbi:hypothetical protein [Limnospira platensis]|uniref:hypothetical protein n=1 Tax=Limnospira platensis TaxID=118562 RepID=UPI00137700CF|nr:hypothetical protein AP9108_36005 [Arthrospira sp. PCC 9108]
MRYHPRSPNELGTLIIPNSLTNLGAIAFFFPKCDRLTKNRVSLSHRKCDRTIYQPGFLYNVRFIHQSQIKNETNRTVE